MTDELLQDSLPIAERLHALLAEDRESSDFLNELARLSAENFRGDQKVLCGIILERPKKNSVVASSCPEAQRMDEVQAGFDEGPCLEALRTGSLIHVSDIRTETRWPKYMAAVREHRVRSVLAIPLDLGGGAVAAMNFYAEEQGSFDADEVATVKLYAGLAEKVLLVAVRTAKHADAAHHRQAAMESRTSIDIAIGIVMAQNRCSRDDAFAILQRASSHRNIKLREIAEHVVASIGHGSPATEFDD